MQDWDPNDPDLEAEAPHELSGVMRWHRAKVPSRKIMELLHLRGTQLIKKLETASEEERSAVKTGRPIHDALIPKELES